MSTKANGPSKTADSALKEIYTIPSSSPVYKVTYVTQTNATATTVESSSGCATTSQGHNPYAQWGSSVATRNGQAIESGRAGNHSARNNARLPNFDRSARDSHAESERHGGARHERNIRWA